MEQDEMTQTELKSYLETLAKLVEATAKDPQDAARIIREARQAAGLTQKELAEKLDVTIGTIGYYERGAGMPKTDNLFALCDILHIRPADLLRADS